MNKKESWVGNGCKAEMEIVWRRYSRVKENKERDKRNGRHKVLKKVTIIKGMRRRQ